VPDNHLSPPDAIDATTRAELDALLGRLRDTRATKVGFPDASDFDYTDLAPFFTGYLLNNLGDPNTDGTYPWHTKPMERQAVATVAGLLRADEGDWWGYVTSGAAEGSEWALWQARRRYPEAIVYTSAATHHAIGAAMDRLDLATVTIRTDAYGEIDYQDLAGQLDRHRAWPAIVVANIGTAMHEAVDDVRRIRAILDDLAIARRWVHADAALSGLPLALLEPDRRPGMDFADGADSIIVSGHKFLGAPIPYGVVLARDSLREQGRRVTYTGAPDATLTNSRSGLAALVLWYTLRRHGIDGLRRRAEQARHLAAYAHGRMVEIGWAGAHRHPHAFTVTFAAPSPDVAARWSLPDERGHSHIVCMPGVTKEQINAFIADLTADLAADRLADRAGVADPVPVSTQDGRRSGRGGLLRRLIPATTPADAG